MRATDYRGPVVREGPTLLVRWRAFLALELFVEGLFAVMVLIPIVARLAGAPPVGSDRTGDMVFFVCLPLVVAYLLTATLLNRVEIRVDDDRLTSRLTPLPTWLPASVPVHRIRRVEAQQPKDDSPDEGGSITSWWLVAVLDDGSERKLSSRLRSEEEARFVATTIERHLGIGVSRDPS